MHKLKLSFLDIFINVIRHIVRFSPHHVSVESMYKKFPQSVVTVKCAERGFFFPNISHCTDLYFQHLVLTDRQL